MGGFLLKLARLKSLSWEESGLVLLLASSPPLCLWLSRHPIVSSTICTGEDSLGSLPGDAMATDVTQSIISCFAVSTLSVTILLSKNVNRVCHSFMLNQRKGGSAASQEMAW